MAAPGGHGPQQFRHTAHAFLHRDVKPDAAHGGQLL
jgi:hypothetical protein